MDGGDGHPPETVTQDEVGTRSRVRGRPTEVSWHLGSSFASSSVLTSPQDMLERQKHSQVIIIVFKESGKCSMCGESKRMI